jgi:transglutaminase-like putative cysteine protease
MTFGRQKRLLLGWMALLAPIPLPFNGVVQWPLLALYLLGVVLFLRRAAQDPPHWLPMWAMNVLGLAYVPFFFLDLFVLAGGRLVQAVLHLCMFTLLVKLWAMVRERDKWQSAIGIFFLFMAAMGTSVHPAIVLYLIAFLVLALMMLTRFAFLHVLAGFGREDPALARLPLSGFMTFATVLTLLLAVPLFALLPRVRSPYIVGRGVGTGTQIEAAGFSDEVTLDSIGQIRNSREVALRLLEDAPLDPNREMRFKAATFDEYRGGTWGRAPRDSTLERSTRARFWLRRQKPQRWVTIFLQPLRSRSLPLPVETVVVEPGVTRLDVDEGGALSFAAPPLEVREYRVGLIDEPVLIGNVPKEIREPALNSEGVTPRITRLAREVMGEGSARERARRLEQHLMQSYQYTLDFRGRTADNPIESFLFDSKSGQCEYFASSMVLMLRSQGIPARLVTGFLGGEYNPFEGYFIVRESNAHAWVEAWIEGEGWQVFDPTPPAGRPAGGGEGVWLLTQQAWDYVLFRWDRYVLTYGVYDQLRFFGGLHELWADFWKFFDRRDKAASPRPEPAATAAPALPEQGRAGRKGWPFDVPLPVALGLTLVAAGVFVAWLRLRPPLTATMAYRRLRRRLGRSGAPIPESVPPLRLGEEAAARYPAAAGPLGRVIAFYLRESFGGEPLREDEREVLKSALEEAERGLRKAG